MTTVCAVHIEGDGTWVGSDRQQTFDDTRIMGTPKWFGAYGWAVASAGNARTHNLLEQNVDAIFNKVADVAMVVDRLLTMFEDHNYNHDEDEGPRTFGQDLIVCAPKKEGRGIWGIASCGAYWPVPINTLWAEGSGRSFAIGAAMFVSGGREKCEAALAAAIQYDIYSGGEPYVARLEDVDRL